MIFGGGRPRYLRPTASAEGMLHGTVALTERFGSETVVDISPRDGSKVIAAIAGDRVPESGVEIGRHFDAGQAHVFAREQMASSAH